jgi:hypothetical protein
MAVVRKRKLSGSTDGKAIKVGAIGTPGKTIHTATGVSVPGSFDEIWLWGHNSGTKTVVLTLEWGGTSSPDDILRFTLSAGSGLVPLIPGFILQNGQIVGAFANEANVVTVNGFINTITD